MRILAIDIGGTKSAVGLCELNGRSVTNVHGLTKFVSRNYNSLPDMIRDWQTKHPDLEFEGIGAGVAGPVVNGKVHLTNLGWDIDSASISAKLKQTVKICNDMESHGWGILGLTSEHLVTLNQGQPASGAKALIAAGTGLGESIIGWNGQNNHPMPGEGGHSSFSPTTDLEDDLLKWLRKEYSDHVSWERVLGGLDGFRNLARFLAKNRAINLPKYISDLPHDQHDWGIAIITAAISGDSFAHDIVTMYATLYGKEAANLALKCVPAGGVYIGGGVAPRILPWLKNSFMNGFTDKGRFGNLLKTIPVHVITDDLNGLKGAALQF